MPEDDQPVIEQPQPYHDRWDRLRKAGAYAGMVISLATLGALAQKADASHAATNVEHIDTKPTPEQAVGGHRLVSQETVKALAAAERPVVFGNRQHDVYDQEESTATLITLGGKLYGLSDVHGLSGWTADFPGSDTGFLDIPKPLDFYNPKIADSALASADEAYPQRLEQPEYFINGMVVAPHLDSVLYKLQPNPRFLAKDVHAINFDQQKKLSTELELGQQVVFTGFSRGSGYKLQIFKGRYLGIFKTDGDREEQPMMGVLLYGTAGPGVSGGSFAADVPGGTFVSAGASQTIHKGEQSDLWAQVQNQSKLDISGGVQVVYFPVIGNKLSTMTKDFGHSAFSHPPGGPLPKH